MSTEWLEEVEILRSIYDESISISVVSLDESGLSSVTYEDPAGLFTIFIEIPPIYPHTIPMISLSCRKFYENIRVAVLESCHKICEEMIGTVMIFNLIENIRETFSNLNIAEETHLTDDFNSNNDEKSTEREQVRVQPQRSVLSHNVKVIHGPVTTETKSSFQAHFAVVTSMEEVLEFREIVYEDKRVARATHNIFAYRFTCPTTGVVYHDCDDDGEAAAGGRLAEMIRLMKVDNIAVIVTRWFGGVLLGPDRFKFICNSARDLLEEHGYGKSAGVNKRHNKKS